MANPIKASDLYIDDGAIQKAISEFEQFRAIYLAGIAQMQSEAKQMKTAQSSLNSALDSGRSTLSNNATAAANLKAQYDQYTAALNKVETELKQLQVAQARVNEEMARNKRNSQGAVDQNRNLIGSTGKLTKAIGNLAASYLGLSSAIQVLKNVFNITKRLDALDVAFRKVTKTQTNQVKAMSFLRDITEKYGLELLSTTKSYLKFNAAVNTTTLGIKKGEEIFRSFAKVNAILGLSADDAKGVFLALEQMISKGKVSTEELRLQMGERIPGAFQIMAKAVGVTSGELADMLKKGEIMTEDVLPKFTKELEAAFGVEQLDRIDTLVGAQNRLTNAWTDLVEELNQREVFKNVLNFLTKVLTFTRDNITAIASLAKIIVTGTAAWVAYRSAIALSAISMGSYAAASTAAAGATGGFTIATRLASVAMAAFNTVLRLNPLGLVLSLITAVVVSLELFNDTVKDGTELIKESYQEVEEEEIRMRALLTVIKDGNRSLAETKRAREELMALAPSFLEGLDLEKLTLAELLSLSDKYNESLRDRNTITALQDRLDPVANEIKQLEAKLAHFEQTQKSGLAGIGSGLLPIQIQQVRDDLEIKRRQFEDITQEIQKIFLREEETPAPAGVSTGGGVTRKTKKKKPIKTFINKAPDRSEQGRLDLQFLSAKQIRKAQAEHMAFLRTMVTIPTLAEAEIADAALKDFEETVKRGRQNLADFAESQKPKTIWDLIGLNFDDPEGETNLMSGLEFAKNQLKSFFDLNSQLAEQRVTDSNKAVSQAQKDLQIQLKLAELGYANNVDDAQKNLDLEKKTQEKALQQRRKAQQAELALQTIEQGANLITASTKILRTVPFPFNLAAVTVMFGAFAAAKLKALQLTKKKFGKGGYVKVGGGTHASGDDTALGVNVNGQPAYVEKDEGIGIVKAAMVRKYGSLIPTVINSFNNGTFDRMFDRQKNIGAGIPMFFTGPAGTDMSKAETELAAIRKQGEKQTMYTPNGHKVVIEGNRETIFMYDQV